MKVLLGSIFTIFCFQLTAQNLEIIQNQWEAIANAKTPKEKLMRNCRLAALGHYDQDFETGKIVRNADLNVLAGISDMIDDSSRIRMISRFFEIERGKYQYNYNLDCVYRRDSTFTLMSGKRACFNNHEISCKPCNLKSDIKNDWEGAFYTEMTASYQDSMMYLNLKGEQYHLNGTVPVMHTFAVAPRCKIKFIDDTE